MYSINLNNVANNNIVNYTADCPLLTCFSLSPCKVVLFIIIYPSQFDK